MIRAPYQDPDWPTRIFSFFFWETRQRAFVWQQAVTESCSWINIGSTMSRWASEATKNAFSARAIGPQNSGAKRTAGPREQFFLLHPFVSTDNPEYQICFSICFNNWIFVGMNPDNLLQHLFPIIQIFWKTSICWKMKQLQHGNPRSLPALESLADGQAAIKVA